MKTTIIELRDHTLSLCGLKPGDTCQLRVCTTDGERLPDMTITAADGFLTSCHPSYWSLFRAADMVARRLGRRDLWVSYKDCDRSTT